MRRIISYPILFLAAITLIVEEAIWDKISSVMAKIARLKFFQIIEAWVAKQNRYIILGLFVVPCAMSFSIKLIGFFLIASGHFVDGVSIIVFAEILGTSIMVRLFMITKPKLLTFQAFNYVYVKVNILKDWAKNFITQSEAWQHIKSVIGQVKTLMRKQKRTIMSWRFIAARRFIRRR